MILTLYQFELISGRATFHEILEPLSRGLLYRLLKGM